MRITFDLFGFVSKDDAIAKGYFRPLLSSLCAINEAYLSRHKAPLLYASGVRYEREPPGQEDWKDIPAILRDGQGDCEDLASYRVAELRRQGVDARPILKVRRRQGRVLYHVLVGIRTPDGRDLREDPSRRLGM